ncbi:DUF3833 domain-containing protein [Lacimicrobium alkaliphilum]|uniref:Lipoprotein n=1 Tax=Lacimicrobium alkaliphilum TaxID=1526571 RepID=A0ABQ1RGK8_9ALTE|nr:DUF3833 domain-containing protein [Lacimicrobium alkaliphilum]GGD66320.1 lipoprotein [Lacimicrobium alkaliphilum]
MKLLLLLCTFILSACSSSLDSYANKKPEFNLAEYFNGKITARGIIEDYSGTMTRHFCVDIIGSWENNTGRLHETFYFDDGEKQVRIWELQIAADGKVTGQANDVVGEASGETRGNAFNWKYVLEVPIDGSVYELAVDDWLYRLDEDRLMNRSYMKKFGVTVAEISIYFDRSQPLKGCNEDA